MISTVARLYARRIVNINVNILVAGVLALAPTVLIVSFTTHNGYIAAWSERFSISTELTTNAVTFVADLFFDIIILYTLHWLANHWPRVWRKKNEDPDTVHLSYWRDATLVQFERMVLSPIMYGLFLGVQHVLLTWNVSPELATICGYICGGAVTRTLHTLWMLRQRRKNRERAAARAREATIPVAPTGALRPDGAARAEPEHVSSIGGR
jgi:hypothetical protein